MSSEYKPPEVIKLFASDIRMHFNTRSIGITIDIPLELLEDSQTPLASVSLIAKLIQMLPTLQEDVLDYKKVCERMRSHGL